jgi:hypothetical protein
MTNTGISRYVDLVTARKAGGKVFKPMNCCPELASVGCYSMHAAVRAELDESKSRWPNPISELDLSKQNRQCVAGKRTAQKLSWCSSGSGGIPAEVPHVWWGGLPEARMEAP